VPLGARVVRFKVCQFFYVRDGHVISRVVMLFEAINKAIIRHTLYKGHFVSIREGPVLEAIWHFKVLGMRVGDRVPRHQETQNGQKMVPFLLCKDQRFFLKG
jgi:hypothetical protein